MDTPAEPKELQKARELYDNALALLQEAKGTLSRLEAAVRYECRAEDIINAAVDSARRVSEIIEVDDPVRLEEVGRLVAQRALVRIEGARVSVRVWEKQVEIYEQLVTDLESW
jgi:hypothetical protein